MTETNHQFIAIMAGGVGSRFWPASTENMPKQFLDILGIGRSLLQMTWDRARQLVPASRILVVTNEKYAPLVRNQLPDIAPENILKEPAMRNTAPCVAYAALRILAVDPEASFAVLPSDHVILKEETYIRLLQKSFDYAASHDALVTLGIKPTRPDTGYGYIQFDAGTDQLHLDSPPEHICKVRSFKEKPDLTTAQKYLDSGEYLWNAGMFIWKAETILNAFRKFAPEIINALTTQPNPYNTSDEQAWINQRYPEVSRISIDYAIMERADNVYTIPADIGWSDLGTWQSLHAYLAGESDAIAIGNHVYLSDCSDVLVVSNNQKPVVVKGLTNYIVVDDINALLIYPKSDEQEIRDVVANLSKEDTH